MKTSDNITRRQMLQGMGIGAAAVAMTGMTSCAPTKTSSSNSAEDSSADSQKVTIDTPDETLEFDVVVCGSGMGGMSTALQAAYDGAKVAIVEKAKFCGGGTNYAEGIFAVGSPKQKEMGIDYDVKSILATEYDFQHFIVDTKLWEVIANNSATDIAWLMDQGVEFIDVFNTGGNEYTHHIYPEYRGMNAIKVLQAKAESLGVEIFTSAPAEHLLTEGDEIVGVQVRQNNKVLHFRSKATVLATGSAGANSELLARYSARTPDKTFYTGAPGVEGDGIRMASEAGMGECFRLMMPAIGLTVEPLLVYQSELAVAGAMEPMNMWFNQRGERFGDEGLSVTYIFPNNQVESQVKAFSLFDQAQFDRLVNEGCVMGWAMYIFAGEKLVNLQDELDTELSSKNPNVCKADTIEEVAAFFDVDPATLTKTVENYNGYVDAGNDEQYHKDPDFLVPVSTPPYYAFRIKQNCINMFGGIHINPKNEVIREDGSTIAGLYAAGSECGGYQGETYGMALPGSCQGVSLGTGRVAGANAAAYAKA